MEARAPWRVLTTSKLQFLRALETNASEISPQSVAGIIYLLNPILCRCARRAALRPAGRRGLASRVGGQSIALAWAATGLW